MEVRGWAETVTKMSVVEWKSDGLDCLYGYEMATIDSDFNFIGYAATLLKKGANESFTVTNNFRDI